MRLFTTECNNWHVIYKTKEEAWKELKGSRRYWYADPILTEWNGRKFLFLEAYDLLWSVGRIAISEWDGEKFNTPQIIIKKPYHMSYPCVFEYKKILYMIPETCQNRTIELYKMEEDSPYKWKKIQNLMNDVIYVDSTVFFNSHTYYVVSYEGGKSGWMTHIFTLDMEQMEIQKIETIVSENNTERPAGKGFEAKGCIFRPVQFNMLRYGEYITVERINSFTPFQARKVRNVEVNDLKVDIFNDAVLGTHTLALDEKLCIVDVLVSEKNIFAIWVNVLRKVRRLIFRILN